MQAMSSKISYSVNLCLKTMETSCFCSIRERYLLPHSSTREEIFLQKFLLQNFSFLLIFYFYILFQMLTGNFYSVSNNQQYFDMFHWCNLQWVAQKTSKILIKYQYINMQVKKRIHHKFFQSITNYLSNVFIQKFKYSPTF